MDSRLKFFCFFVGITAVFALISFLSGGNHSEPAAQSTYAWDITDNIRLIEDPVNLKGRIIGKPQTIAGGLIILPIEYAEGGKVYTAVAQMSNRGTDTQDTLKVLRANQQEISITRYEIVEKGAQGHYIYIVNQ